MQLRNRAFSISWIAIVVLLVSLAIILFSGCTPKQEPAIADDAAPSQTPPPINELWHRFGEVHTYDDGISISVGTPVEFETSETAEIDGTVRAHNFAWSITVNNGSTEDFYLQAFPKVWSGEYKGSLIMDADNPVGTFEYAPSPDLSPGESYTWLIGYSGDDPSALTVYVSPGFDYEDAEFTNIAP